MAKNILSLSASDVTDFMLKSDQYHGFELPEYFNFDEVLQFVKETIGDKKYEECISSNEPDNLENVNMDILLNKDGKYAIRPLVLANPYLYYFLVREISNPTNWEKIQSCFKSYSVPHITSCALPIVPDKIEPFHRSATILNWWNAMEQRSIELSMDYRYMFVTDITNCYGSINPRSIEWALSCYRTQYENHNNLELSTNIQKYLRALQHGHNIGIPQGSALFDLIGEIVLGYSDLLLYEALHREHIEDYEIIRYRDDYHIFCNNRNDLERISYILQGVLDSLNFRMNSQKTKISESIVTDSIKSDKLWYIFNTPIFNKKGADFDSFEKHLLYILMFSRKYPNSGQIKTLLSDLDKRIEKWLKPYEVEMVTIPLEEGQQMVKKKETMQRRLVGGSVLAMTAVAVQIAIENVTVSHYVLRVISRMIDSLKDMKEKRHIISKVYDKLCKQPNSDYNQLWLQNMTYTQDVLNNTSPYTLRLCQLVAGKEVEPLWNNDWLDKSLTEALPYNSIVNKETLKNVTPIITFKETRAYNSIYPNE